MNLKLRSLTTGQQKGKSKSHKQHLHDSEIDFSSSIRWKTGKALLMLLIPSFILFYIRKSKNTFCHNQCKCIPEELTLSVTHYSMKLVSELELCTCSKSHRFIIPLLNELLGQVPTLLVTCFSSPVIYNI